MNYAVFLHPGSPGSLLSMFSGYLQKRDENAYFLCSSFEPLGNFVQMAIKRKGQADWSIQIPAAIVMVVADMSEDRPYPFGFAPEPDSKG
jgi:hypothetical protein